MAKSLHAIRFPGESDGYRAARDKLLKAEMELRRNLEEVAALRRGLPPGGQLKEDYVFERMNGERVRFSQLFSEGKDSLIIYSFMFGPEMEQACPSCTSILDALDGASPHVNQRVNLFVVAKSPVARIKAFAQNRGWRNLRLLSSANHSYNRDYQGENAKGNQIPSLNVFTRRDGKFYHFYNTIKPDRVKRG
jgi:predicted dithiol-disulfide oxidoreductase (DUF899 family)